MNELLPTGAELERVGKMLEAAGWRRAPSTVLTYWIHKDDPGQHWIGTLEAFAIQQIHAWRGTQTMEELPCPSLQ